MDSSFHLIHTAWKQSRDALGSVRRSVFIDEQQVPEELEWDEFDESSHHVLVTDAANRPLATGRIKPDGHIGRMAVLPEYRQQGVGSAMLAALLDPVFATWLFFSLLAFATVLLLLLICLPISLFCSAAVVRALCGGPSTASPAVWEHRDRAIPPSARHSPYSSSSPSLEGSRTALRRY